MYEIFRLFSFLLGLYLLYQSYKAVRASVTGTQNEMESPTDDPSSISNRAAGLGLGVFSFLAALGVFAYAFRVF